MTFTHADQLTPKQYEAACKRWEKLAGYEYQFGAKGAAVARRKLPKGAGAAKVPAPAAKPAEPEEPATKPGKFQSKKPPINLPDETEAAANAPEAPAVPPPEAGEPKALPPPAETAGAPVPFAAPLAGQIISVPLVCMVDSPTNPRTAPNQTKHEELCDSLRAHGWIEAQAALLRPIPGVSVLALPVAIDRPEGQWHLVHAETREPLPCGRFTEAEAEHLAKTKYGQRYEIVFAHRRRRAAQSIGLTEAPAVVRNLSDQEVLEIQLLENAQREDLSPIEEAEHLARLIALRGDNGQPVYTRETLAKRIGKSVPHVRDTLLLCRLDGVARAAVTRGELGLSIAYEVARIPDCEAREAAAKEILNPTEGEAPMRARAALDYIRRVCTRNLRADAKFPTDDPELVPERFKIEPDAEGGTARYFGGSCVGCPFNSASASTSANAPKLGVCGNVACFEAKVAADFERFRAAHNKPEAGKVVVTAERNAELFDGEGEIDWRSGLVRLTDVPDAGLLKADAFAGEVPMWKELTKGRLPEVLIARDPKGGKKVECVDVEKAKAAAELNGHLIFRTSKAKRLPNTAAGDAEHKTQTLEKQRQLEINRGTENGILGTAAQKVTALGYLPPGGWKFLADWICGAAQGEAVSKVEARRKLENGTLGDVIQTLSDGELIGLSVELAIADHYHFGCDEGAGEMLDLLGIDVGQIAKEVAGALAEPAKAEPPAGDLPLPAGDGWRALKFTRGELVNVFGFNEHDVCELPDAIAVELPTGKKQPLAVRLQAAFRDGFWFSGHVIDGKAFSSSSPCASTGEVRGSRFRAFAEAAHAVAARLDAEERVETKVRLAMRKVAAAMDDFATAEELPTDDELPAEDSTEPGVVLSDPPPAAGDLPPTFLAYLTLHAMRLGNVEPVVKTYDAADWVEALALHVVVWVCPIAGVESIEGAVAGAKEALREAAGTVTHAGNREGFHFECDDKGVPAPVLGKREEVTI